MKKKTTGIVLNKYQSKYTVIIDPDAFGGESSLVDKNNLCLFKLSKDGLIVIHEYYIEHKKGVAEFFHSNQDLHTIRLCKDVVCEVRDSYVVSAQRRCRISVCENVKLTVDIPEDSIAAHVSGTAHCTLLHGKVHATGHSVIHAYNDSYVESYKDASVSLRDTATCGAHEHSSVSFADTSQGNCYDNTHAEIQDRAHVNMYDESFARMYHDINMQVHAYGTSHISCTCGKVFAHDFAVIHLQDGDVTEMPNFFGSVVRTLRRAPHDMTVYKAVRLENKNQGVAKLLIKKGTRIRCGEFYKCRASKALVLSIYDKDHKEYTQASSLKEDTFVYHVNKIVKPLKKFNESENECESGIHFFLREEQAFEYCL